MSWEIVGLSWAMSVTRSGVMSMNWEVVGLRVRSWVPTWAAVGGLLSMSWVSWAPAAAETAVTATFHSTTAFAGSRSGVEGGSRGANGVLMQRPFPTPPAQPATTRKWKPSLGTPRGRGRGGGGGRARRPQEGPFPPPPGAPGADPEMESVLGHAEGADRIGQS